MSNELEASVIVTFAGNLQQQAKRYGRSIEEFSRSGGKHMGALERRVSRVDRSINRMGSRWLALGTGAGLALVGKKVSDLSERLNQLGIDAGFNGDKLDQFKKSAISSIESAGLTYGVQTGSIITGIENIVTKTGNIKFAADNMNNLALAISATHGAGGDFGNIFSELEKIGISAPEQVLAVLDSMVAQGQQGAFVLKDMASLGERVFAAYGPSNQKQIIEMGAALQVIRKSTGSSEQAVTSFERLMAALKDGEKVKLLFKAGVKVFDEDGLEKFRKGLAPLSAALLPITDIMHSIAEVTKGDEFTLSKLLSESEARRGLVGLLKEYRETQKTASLDSLMHIKSDGSEILKDAVDNSKELNAQMKKLGTTWNKFANNNLSQPIGDLADFLSSLDSSELDRIVDKLKDLAIAAGIAVIGFKAMQGGFALQNISGKLRNSATPDNPLTAAAGSLAPIPVFVVNQGGLPGAAGLPGGAAGKPAKAGRIARLGSFAAVTSGAALQLAGSAAVGYGIGTILNKTLLEGTILNDAIGAGIARTLALFGNDEAQAAVDRTERFAKMEIEFTGDGAANARVKSLSSSDDLAVEAGGSMEGF